MDTGRIRKDISRNRGLQTLLSSEKQAALKRIWHEVKVHLLPELLQWDIRISVSKTHTQRTLPAQPKLEQYWSHSQKTKHQKPTVSAAAVNKIPNNPHERKKTETETALNTIFPKPITSFFNEENSSLSLSPQKTRHTTEHHTDREKSYVSRPAQPPSIQHVKAAVVQQYKQQQKQLPQNIRQLLQFDKLQPPRREKPSDIGLPEPKLTAPTKTHANVRDLCLTDTDQNGEVTLLLSNNQFLSKSIKSLAAEYFEKQAEEEEQTTTPVER